MNTNYQHAMAGHCESGVISGWLCHGGLQLSEPLVFGISGAFFFGYFDNARFAIPMLALHSQPGDIRKQIAKRLASNSAPEFSILSKKDRQPWTHWFPPAAPPVSRWIYSIWKISHPICGCTSMPISW